jgi:hypothetical protein
LERLSRLQLYCERDGPGPWAEPLNLVSNLAFFVAAALLWRALRRPAARPLPWEAPLIVALLAAVGAGSALWHSFARPWAQAADVVPIGLLVTVLFISVLRRGLGASKGTLALALGGFALANAAVALLVSPARLGGSPAYGPAWLAFGALAVSARGRPIARPLARSFVLFTVSLTLRTLDGPLCGVWPWGTHFAWHLLNAVVLFDVGRATVLGRPR